MSLHPAIVHFPIALSVASFIFDLIAVVTKDDSFRKAGLYCLLMALFGAGAAYWTGVQAAEASRHIPGIADTLKQHEMAGIFTLASIGVLLIARLLVESRSQYQRMGRVVYLLLSLAAVVNVLRTGALGGDLVQKFGAGVEPVMRRLEMKEQESGATADVPVGIQTERTRSDNP